MPRAKRAHRMFTSYHDGACAEGSNTGRNSPLSGGGANLQHRLVDGKAHNVVGGYKTGDWMVVADVRGCNALTCYINCCYSTVKCAGNIGYVGLWQKEAALNVEPHQISTSLALIAGT